MPSVQSKVNHVCKLKGHTYKSGGKIFFCTLPDCTKKMKAPFALGKKSICWRCGNEFEMNEYSLRLVKPHCPDCHKSKNETVKVTIPIHTHLDQDENQNVRVIADEPIIPLAERMKKLTQLNNEIDEEL